MYRTITFTSILLVLLAGLHQSFSQNGSNVPRVDHVLHISVDGLRPDVITSMGQERLPNFFRFRTEGAWTDNARTDRSNTSTIPGHTSQVTGRQVLGKNAHNFIWNSDPGPVTLHTFAGYIASAFDVAHDHGLSTALYAGKSKFILFENSYNASNGAPDITGENNGKDKIDTYVYNGDMAQLTAQFISDYKVSQYGYAFFHFRYPDSQGHSTGWNIAPLEEYSQKVAEVDALIGDLFATIENTPGLAGRTAIILTADHGGELGSTGHGNLLHPDNYTIPFYVWGPGVAMGADLYALNAETRRDPSYSQEYDEDAIQPIRYADVANLSLNFLGLPSVPGSGFNVDQSLAVTSDGAVNIVIQNGLNNYSGTVDTYIRRHEKNSAYGNRTTLIVDDADPWWSGRDNQALLRFDNIIGNGQHQVPQNVNVVSATLNVRVINAGNGGSLHRMLRTWSENETWNTLDNGIQANDVEAVRHADGSVSNTSEGMLSIDVTESLQAWSDGAGNYGWAILPDGGDGWDFYSSEGYMQPRLNINYTYDTYQAKSISAETSKVEQEVLTALETPEAVSLKGNFPNPFSGITTIRYELHKNQKIRMEVFDSQGKPVSVIVDEIKEAGSHEAEFDGRNLSKGLYILRFLSQGEDAQTVLTHTMVLR
ncbi:alkaline phosphatase family protein [Fulvivirga ulvae]|uniref:alkaline phosphatase family protein n=1 Tax=Fulvivirga ulvae TaxID=2904245 RepID=UPI001F3FB6C8|nr:alkaline phosphatase family protein [Fulvivirga ulvae]UII32776.1 alkaline phosphatase family protein [Fulvivirga ulvae]